MTSLKLERNFNRISAKQSTTFRAKLHRTRSEGRPVLRAYSATNTSLRFRNTKQQTTRLVLEGEREVQFRHNSKFFWNGASQISVESYITLLRCVATSALEFWNGKQKYFHNFIQKTWKFQCARSHFSWDHFGISSTSKNCVTLQYDLKNTVELRSVATFVRLETPCFIFTVQKLKYSQLFLYRTRLYRNSHIPDREFQNRRNSSQYVLYNPRYSDIPDF